MTLPATALAVRSDYPDPLWMQAVDVIRRDVAEGRLAVGSRLPPERELCEALSISRVTLRKALAKLVDDGVLRSSHGRGWFVAAAGGTDWPNSLESFSETADRMGLRATSGIVRQEIVPATIDEAEELSIAPGAPLFHLERVRLLDGVPIALDDSRVPAALVPGIETIDFGMASLYERLAAQGIHPHGADSTIEARSADAALAVHLSVQPGTPVLVMHQVVVDATEHPVLASTIRYAGERYRLRTFFARAPFARAS